MKMEPLPIPSTIPVIKAFLEKLPEQGRLEILRYLFNDVGNQLTPEELQDILTSLPKGEAPVAPHKMCSLDVQRIAPGLLRATFTIPKGMSGKMVLDAVEMRNPRSLHDGVVMPDCLLLEDPGLDDIVDRDTQFSTTLCFNANNRNRDEQGAYLKDKGLGFTDRWIVTVAAALYRDANGFPEKRPKIGSPEDNGDLFGGCGVRAISGAVCLYPDGICSSDCKDSFPHFRIIAAGSPLQNNGDS